MIYSFINIQFYFIKTKRLQIYIYKKIGANGSKI